MLFPVLRTDVRRLWRNSPLVSTFAISGESLAFVSSVNDEKGCCWSGRLAMSLFELHDFLDVPILKNIETTNMVIIGNAPYDLKLPLGGLVDSFENIMRFNDFSVASRHERYVGSKTTIWCYFNINPVIRKRNFIGPKGHSKELIVMRGNYLSKQVRKHVKSGFAENIPGSIAKEINSASAFSIGRRRRKKFPSTGVMGIAWALSKGYKPLVIGFNGFMNEGSKHYYNKMGNAGRKNHSGDKEIQLLKMLHQEGKICFLDVARSNWKARIAMM